MGKISVNKEAMKVVKKIMDEKERLQVNVINLKNGSTVIDMGVEAKGGYEAGLLMGLVCLGGLATITWDSVDVDGKYLLPALTVTTDHPAIACMGSQFAGWRKKVTPNSDTRLTAPPDAVRPGGTATLRN